MAGMMPHPSLFGRRFPLSESSFFEGKMSYPTSSVRFSASACRRSVADGSPSRMRSAGEGCLNDVPVVRICMPSMQLVFPTALGPTRTVRCGSGSSTYSRMLRNARYPTR